MRSGRMGSMPSSRAGRAAGWRVAGGWSGAVEGVGEDGVTLGGLVDGLDLRGLPGVEENLDRGAAVAAGDERAIPAGFDAGVALQEKNAEARGAGSGVGVAQFFEEQRKFRSETGGVIDDDQRVALPTPGGGVLGV